MRFVINFDIVNLRALLLFRVVLRVSILVVASQSILTSEPTVHIDIATSYTFILFMYKCLMACLNTTTGNFVYVNVKVLTDI